MELRGIVRSCLVGRNHPKHLLGRVMWADKDTISSSLQQCTNKRLWTERPHAGKYKSSYCHGVCETPLVGTTIGQLLQSRAEELPDKEAFVFSKDGVRKTYSQLLNDADSFAAGLVKMGIKRGDRVGIWGPNTYEWIIVQYATTRIGAILVNINPLYKRKELEYTLLKVGCKALVAAEIYQDVDYFETLCHIIPELIRCKPGETKSQTLPEFKTLIMMGEKYYPGSFKFGEVAAMTSDKEKRSVIDLQDKIQFDQAINIQFTSGTTGQPKGATLTHHNLVNNAYFIGNRLDYHNRDTRICIPVPLYHCFGMVLGSLCGVAHGGTCIFPSPGFNAEATLRACSEEKVTSLYGVPTMFIDMLNHPRISQFNLEALYTGVMAGSPCPIEVVRKVTTQMNMKQVAVSYGSTETSPITLQGFPDDDLEKKASTVGFPMPHTEAKIVDLDGNIQPVGLPGELCVRGYATMLGYWDDIDKTNKVMAPGNWYRSGDIAEMDSAGYFKIVGRIKDMVIRGGENVYPVEIEQCLYKHPKIKDAQVVGVPDARLGEELCAWIKLKDGEVSSEEEIQAYCKERLARFKVPKYFQFVDEYPLTASGKVQKNKIRQLSIEKLALEQDTPPTS